MCDGRWSEEVRTQIVKFGVLEIVHTVHTQENKAAHSTVVEEHKKYKSSVRKKIPLTPQVHTADIPRDLRAHMDKSAFFS
jgi:hypothetical protein